MRSPYGFPAFIFFLASAVSILPAWAEQGVEDHIIRIGMSNALSGASADLGKEVKAGTQAYLQKVNSAGGVHGRKIELISEDDRYEPELAARATQKLIDVDHVFALTGFVGTPTGKAAVPILSQRGVPLVGMFTGAETFRNPVNRNIFHVRGSYFAETELLVNHMLDDRKITSIGIFRQDDAFGDAGKAGVQRALAKRDMKLAGEGVFKRNSEDVDSALDALIQAKPEGVILVGSYKGCAKFMKKAIARGWHPLFANISFVGTRSLIEEAGAAAEGSFITQVVPLLQDYPITRQFKADMKAQGRGEPTFGAFEGYLNAAVLVEGLRRAGKEPTRDRLRASLESIKDWSIGGIGLSYSAHDHEGVKEIYLTEVMHGKPVSVQGMK